MKSEFVLSRWMIYKMMFNNKFNSYLIPIKIKHIMFKDKLRNKYLKPTQFPKIIRDLMIKHNEIVREDRYEHQMMVIINGIKVDDIWSKYQEEINNKILKINPFIRWYLKIKPSTSDFILYKCPIIENEHNYGKNAEFILLGNYLKREEKKLENGIDEVTVLLMDKKSDDVKFVLDLKNDN